MFNNYINEISAFHKLSKDEKVQYLYSKLSILGYLPAIQTYNSVFGKGNNIIAFLPFDNSASNTILSAHYDGESLFDNSGGVFALLEVASRFMKKGINKNICILLTDQEETFQQGVAYFIKEYEPSIQSYNINIDGFGIGDEIYSMCENVFRNSKNDFFKTDMHKFKEYGINGNSYFSSFIKDYNEINITDKSIKDIYTPYADEKFYKKSFNISTYSKTIDSLCEIIYA